MPNRWYLSADQWFQTFWEFRDGKLYFAEQDNKDQAYSEREEDIAAFIDRYAGTTAKPYAEIVAFLQSR